MMGRPLETANNVRLAIQRFENSAKKCLDEEARKQQEIEVIRENERVLERRRRQKRMLEEENERRKAQHEARRKEEAAFQREEEAFEREEEARQREEQEARQREQEARQREQEARQREEQEALQREQEARQREEQEALQWEQEARQREEQEALQREEEVSQRDGEAFQTEAGAELDQDEERRLKKLAKEEKKQRKRLERERRRQEKRDSQLGLQEEDEEDGGIGNLEDAMKQIQEFDNVMADMNELQDLEVSLENDEEWFGVVQGAEDMRESKPDSYRSNLTGASGGEVDELEKETREAEERNAKVLMACRNDLNAAMEINNELEQELQAMRADLGYEDVIVDAEKDQHEESKQGWFSLENFWKKSTGQHSDLVKKITSRFKGKRLDEEELSPQAPRRSILFRSNEYTVDKNELGRRRSFVPTFLSRDLDWGSRRSLMSLSRNTEGNGNRRRSFLGSMAPVDQKRTSLFPSRRGMKSIVLFQSPLDASKKPGIFPNLRKSASLKNILGSEGASSEMKEAEKKPSSKKSFVQKLTGRRKKSKKKPEAVTAKESKSKAKDKKAKGKAGKRKNSASKLGNDTDSTKGSDDFMCTAAQKSVHPENGHVKKMTARFSTINIEVEHVNQESLKPSKSLKKASSHNKSNHSRSSNNNTSNHSRSSKGKKKTIKRSKSSDPVGSDESTETSDSAHEPSKQTGLINGLVVTESNLESTTKPIMKIGKRKGLPTRRKKASGAKPTKQKKAKRSSVAGKRKSSSKRET